MGAGETTTAVVRPPEDKKNAALSILKELRNAGYEAYFAGGCVRDFLLGNSPEDYDIATNALPGDVQRLFRRTLPIGKAFGVILVLRGRHQIEVATYRNDGKYADGRHPDSITFGCLEEDALRRDFTINGLYLDPVLNKIIDVVGGQQDLRDKVLRAIGKPQERFAEDALRLLRAVRFAARLDFSIDQDTADGIAEQAPTISRVSMERIGEELTKIFTGAHPGRGLTLLRETSLLEHVLPEVARLHGLNQPPDYHPEGDVFTHVRLMLDAMNQASPSLAWGVIMHDIGKAVTQTISDRIRFKGHEAAGIPIAKAVLTRLKFSNDLIDRVLNQVQHHQKFLQVDKMKLSTLKRFLSLPHFPELLELHRLDSLSSRRSLDHYQFCIDQLAKLGTDRLRPQPLLRGDDLAALGLKPGPVYGQLLAAVEEAQLDERISTREEAIKLCQSLLASS